MKYQKKENNHFKINIDLDKKNQVKFIKEIKRIGKQLEYNSSSDNLKYSIVVYGIKIPDMETGGWSNRCKDFKFVIFLDFDNTLYWQVQAQLELLMNKFNLSPFYVFETESKMDINKQEYGNYNCACFTKKTFSEVFNIQDETTCDQAHKNLPKLYRFKSAILRLKPKGKKGSPVFKCIVGDLKKVYPQDVSSAHINFIRKAYPNIPRIKYKNADGFSELYLSDYKTASP